MIRFLRILAGAVRRRISTTKRSGDWWLLTLRVRLVLDSIW